MRIGRLYTFVNEISLAKQFYFLGVSHRAKVGFREPRFEPG